MRTASCSTPASRATKYRTSLPHRNIVLGTIASTGTTHRISDWARLPIRSTAALAGGTSAEWVSGKPRFEGGRRPAEEHEELTSEALALEAVMLGLRTRDGLDLRRLTDRYGLDLMRSNEKLIKSWVEEGLLEEKDQCLRPTIRGLAVAEGLAASLDLG